MWVKTPLTGELQGVLHIKLQTSEKLCLIYMKRQRSTTTKIMGHKEKKLAIEHSAYRNSHMSVYTYFVSIHASRERNVEMPLDATMFTAT
jgi:hypothetical protein